MLGVKAHHGALVTQPAQYRAAHQPCRPARQGKSSEIQPHICSQMIFKKHKEHTLGKIMFLVYVAEKTEYQHAKEYNMGQHRGVVS